LPRDPYRLRGGADTDPQFRHVEQMIQHQHVPHLARIDQLEAIGPNQSHHRRRHRGEIRGEQDEGVVPAVQHRAISKLARKTNHIERFNNTLRQRVSRLVREALSFSKKLANHIGAIKLFICPYNLTRTAA
jgi:hypothetical protein